MSEVVTRPVLRWHGGKWRLAPWIIQHFPPHRVYVEPFGGAASVLLRKPRAYAEVYNDLDREVVDLFRVLRTPEHARRLVAALALTPFARDEFVEAYRQTDCLIERCRRLVIRSFMGFGSDGTRIDLSTGFRSSSKRSGTTPAHDWVNYPVALSATIDRLRGVVIENTDALACMAKHDGPDVLHYVDPPYLHATRSRSSERQGYHYEMSDGDHWRLLGVVLRLRGMVVLSGYPSQDYDDMLCGWSRVERVVMADGARPRREVLWINPQAASLLQQRFSFEDNGQAA